MKVAILTMGTRGDVQPFTAVGCALRDRGHDVVMAAPKDLVSFASKAGLATIAVPVSAQEIMTSEVGRNMLASGRLFGFLRMVQNAVKGLETQIQDVFLAAVEGADVIVVAPLVMGPGLQLAAHKKTPILTVFLQPIVPTGAFASPIMTTSNLGPLLNKLSHQLLEVLYWQGAKGDADQFAARLGIAPPSENLLRWADRTRMPALHAYSPALLPKPADWSEAHVVTGMVNLPATARARIGEAAPPPGLVEFLDDGPPPVFFGFGSMPVLDPRATLQLVEDVANDCGVRALVGAGWSDLKASSGGTFVVGAFDHDVYLPRCRAAVHHGGCGTTHSVLRAGLPAVVCSFLVDQPFWASRLQQAGVGAHVRYKQLNRARLTAALKSVLDDDTRARAQKLSEVLRGEDGVSVIADHIEGARRVA